MHVVICYCCSFPFFAVIILGVWSVFASDNYLLSLTVSSGTESSSVHAEETTLQQTRHAPACAYTMVWIIHLCPFWQHLGLGGGDYADRQLFSHFRISAFVLPSPYFRFRTSDSTVHRFSISPPNAPMVSPYNLPCKLVLLLECNCRYAVLSSLLCCWMAIARIHNRDRGGGKKLAIFILRCNCGVEGKRLFATQTLK